PGRVDPRLRAAGGAAAPGAPGGARRAHARPAPLRRPQHRRRREAGRAAPVTARARAALVLAPAAGVYAAAVVAAWSRPVVGDFNLFLWWARAVARTGLPAFTDAAGVAHVGNMHPPAYVYSLGAAFALLGPRPAAVVLPNVVGLAVGLVCLAGIARAAGGAPGAFAAGAGLLLVHPFTVQAGLLPDIDTTVMPAAAL